MLLHRLSDRIAQQVWMAERPMTKYDEVIIALFEKLYAEGLDTLEFAKDDVDDICETLGIKIKNIPDVLYTYRSRSELPESITRIGHWIIEGIGKGRYAFLKLERPPHFDVQTDLDVREVLDATPDIVLKYSGSDEQSLLSRIRYNRLIDIFLSLTAYHLQGHSRTTLKEVGQVEIDELYLAVDTNGRQYVIPIEAKGQDARDRIGVAQVRWLIMFAEEHYSDLIIRPVAIKGVADDTIHLVEFNTETDLNSIRIKREMRYKLIREEDEVPPLL